MLPSGNDAAYMLAYHFGKILLKQTESRANKIIIKRKSNRCIFLSHAKSNISADYSFNKDSFLPNDKNDRDLNYSLQYSKDKEFEEIKTIDCCSLNKTFENEISKNLTQPMDSLSMFKSSSEILRFIEEMNYNAELLMMENSHFDSPHGLENKNNKSTAYDMAKLCIQCVKMRDFNLITKCKTYHCNNKKEKANLIFPLKENKTPIFDYKWN